MLPTPKKNLLNTILKLKTAIKTKSIFNFRSSEHFKKYFVCFKRLK
jgi:hypothetical protein